MSLMQKMALVMLWLASMYLAAISLPGCGSVRTTNIFGGSGPDTQADWVRLTEKANTALRENKYVCTEADAK